VVGPYGGIYWRLMNTFLLVRRFLPVCGVILSYAFAGSFTLHSYIIAGAELHLVLHSLFYVAELF
jgi:hypothetical protein